jgi:phosphosulfolactate synthase
MVGWSVGRTDRTSKPRRHGLTHVIDVGVPLEQLRDCVASVSEFADIWKFGFGTSYLDPKVEEKVHVLTVNGINACIGGTLLEAAWLESRHADCLAWAYGAGFRFVEVSNGASAMPLMDKHDLIRVAAQRFTVISEVGSKDPSAMVSGEQWAAEMLADLEAGATWTIAEGRESGTVGVYEPSGAIRWDVVEPIVDLVGSEHVIFEAPRSHQQAAFIRSFGPNVSLGNVATGEILAVEALRRGLRADTIGLPVGARER